MGVLNPFNVGWQPHNWPLLGYPLEEVDLEDFQKGKLMKNTRAVLGSAGVPKIASKGSKGAHKGAPSVSPPPSSPSTCIIFKCVLDVNAICF